MALRTWRFWQGRQFLIGFKARQYPLILRRIARAWGNFARRRAVTDAWRGRQALLHLERAAYDAWTYDARRRRGWRRGRERRPTQPLWSPMGGIGGRIGALGRVPHCAPGRPDRACLPVPCREWRAGAVGRGWRLRFRPLLVAAIRLLRANAAPRAEERAARRLFVASVRAWSSVLAREWAPRRWRALDAVAAFRRELRQAGAFAPQWFTGA